jgi:hypothetical protein
MRLTEYTPLGLDLSLYILFILYKRDGLSCFNHHTLDFLPIYVCENIFTKAKV